MANQPSQIIDDKSPHCIPFILSLLSSHPSASISTPGTQTPLFIIALTAIQGAGKTTLVTKLASTLTSTLSVPPSSVLVLSIDDLYLPHSAQQHLAKTHPANKLIQHRGEPGTHDIALALEIFTALKAGKECRIPRFDKAVYDGEGDRVPESQWDVVNREGEEKIKVVIFEGWCVGFRALSEEETRRRWETSKKLVESGNASDSLLSASSLGSGPKTTLQDHKLEDLLFVNEHLKAYDVLTDSFDALIHIDAQETEYVYDWRLQQERALKLERGTGMTDEQVVTFVNGYYPAYELFTDGLRSGALRGKDEEKITGRQLRLIVGRDRKVVDVKKL